ncbi:aminodeoxychorismate synthase component I [Rhizobium leguminosarum]|uniref:aminodeoxychorismate synthase component I n=1 Tax=Rhizobium leguminosarum TaxID=384 RepID=UPI001621C835|nr:aminodeoxychorismate synthase component I [Rhizobium leguminosarum]MBB4342988.1 para-aminobenzoate synthetase component 1 [Rhizobium leguminosarum]MBB6296066.1 para-aminobenzoate synthetase component 1 [Rhizobium leguminosarum]
MKIVELEWNEPIAIADMLSKERGFVFLDSSLSHFQLGRYSFIGIDPYSEIWTSEDGVFKDGTPISSDPFSALRAEVERFPDKFLPELPPFQGGAIGYFSYDLCNCYERIQAADRPRFPQSRNYHFGLYDLVVSFDQIEKRCWAIATGAQQKDNRHPSMRMEMLLSRIKAIPAREKPTRGSFSPLWTSNFTRENYVQVVDRVKEHIRSGDIYQANISQRFETPLPSDLDPWLHYKRLRTINSATFGAFLRMGDIAIASSSPERFLRIDNRSVETRPIKGTIRRDSDPVRDKALRERLVGSEKERAENIMIVDLMRNDLSRSCVPNSIEVPSLCEIESYAGLHHLVSTVRGVLAEDKTAVDLISDCFPGGSITGAPKIRAMQIIDEIERAGRGIYCGSIGYIGVGGQVDTNIAIRTITFRHNHATFNVGGAITLLSDPDDEFEETLVKARKIFDSFDGGYDARNY